MEDVRIKKNWLIYVIFSFLFLLTAFYLFLLLLIVNFQMVDLNRSMYINVWLSQSIERVLGDCFS